MGFKKTLVVAAVSFWIGTHYSPKFYEEVEKFEEDGFEPDEESSRSPWSMGYDLSKDVRAKLLGWYPSKDPKDNEPMPMAQSEADKLYRFAFDKGWKSASEDKANVGKQYQKLFGTVTAEEVQSEMRGG